MLHWSRQGAAGVLLDQLLLVAQAAGHVFAPGGHGQRDAQTNLAVGVFVARLAAIGLAAQGV